MRVLNTLDLRVATRKRLRRFEKSIARGYNFINDVHYYWWTLGHRFGLAVEKARNTIHP